MSATRPGIGVFRLVLCLSLLATATSLHADEAENLERLRDMPLSRRNDLLKNLDRFSALPSAERAAIRDLDHQLSELDPTVRSRYFAVLRRYHVWLATLSDAQRTSLRDASPDQRLSLMNEYLNAEPKTGAARARNDSKIWTQLTSLSPVLMADQAHWARIWLGLSPKQREEIGRKGLGESERLRLLEHFGQENGLNDQRPAIRRGEAESLLRTIQDRPRLKKNFEQAKPATKRAMIGRLNERRYLIEHESAKVDREHLDRFVAALPSWLLISVDSLPPDAASLRMRILYRMVFPEGTEMPAVEKAKPKPSKAAPAAPPAAPTPASPF